MRFSVFAITAAALLTLSASASAQQAAPAAVKLEVGEWNGTVTPPGSQPAQVKYDVTYAGDTLKIKIIAGEHGSFETTDVKAEGDKLFFKFRPGPEVACELTKTSAGYAGPCTEPGGDMMKQAMVEMSRPKKEGK
jgi:hypothetical protein